MTAADTPDEVIAERGAEWHAPADLDGYPGDVRAPKPVVPQFDADDNCTREGCGHPKAAHGRWTGCTHAPFPGSLAFCFCPVKVWS